MTKEISDKLLHKKIKSFIEDYIKEYDCLEFYFFKNELYCSLYVEKPEFNLNNYSSTFSISIEESSYRYWIILTINDLRQFIKEFEIPYNKVNLYCLKQLNSNIKSCEDEIENNQKQLEKFKSERKELLKHINLPLEFE